MESMHTDVRMKRVRKQFTSNIILAIKPLFCKYNTVSSLWKPKKFNKIQTSFLGFFCVYTDGKKFTLVPTRITYSCLHKICTAWVWFLLFVYCFFETKDFVILLFQSILHTQTLYLYYKYRKQKIVNTELIIPKM